VAWFNEFSGKTLYKQERDPSAISFAALREIAIQEGTAQLAPTDLPTARRERAFGRERAAWLLILANC